MLQATTAILFLPTCPRRLFQAVLRAQASQSKKAFLLYPFSKEYQLQFLRRHSLLRRGTECTENYSLHAANGVRKPREKFCWEQRPHNRKQWDTQKNNWLTLKKRRKTSLALLYLETKQPMAAGTACFDARQVFTEKNIGIRGN